MEDVKGCLFHEVCGEGEKCVCRARYLCADLQAVLAWR